MSNTVHFPSALQSGTSIATRAPSTALDICDLVYGPTIPAWDVIERFYELNALYENPLVTASSRTVISDIHALASQLAKLDVPKPIALLCSLFGLSREGGLHESWFKVSSMWHEVTSVSESDSFGEHVVGSRRSPPLVVSRALHHTVSERVVNVAQCTDGHQRIIVEHTLHVDLLPGLVGQDTGSTHSLPSTSSQLSLSVPRPAASFRGRGTGAQNPRPSILHLSLPILTRLSFNDAGKITHHRDFWDVKDLLGLFPGMSLAQWITTRLIAQGIRGIMGASRMLASSRWSRKSDNPDARDEEEGLSPVAAYARAVKDIGAA
ncbi:hypothetical protein POSPLADRAFT_1059531 [Postia placenta MAD-698-R-SB12]|uniref:Uncharacterized protein n=1 Tax=Postia placenta MAD-698-R-SB12 TaxID=670580 RepID=A0A1X6MSI0_9APHY|nr:hypothetical protein POSPLADRAFT_1059531 [Postia placenta MAD-698-R-SB12]OSX59337.1 hypothetical protein POSPLADRAFT_1059531 [Postia placenta MAD-698-R-SB12]